jgi:hypothetical protein
MRMHATAALLAACCTSIFSFVAAEAGEASLSAGVVALESEVGTASGFLQPDSLARLERRDGPSVGEFSRILPSLARACFTGGLCRSTYDCCAGYHCVLDRRRLRVCVR